jgi:hypothetical protein
MKLFEPDESWNCPHCKALRDAQGQRSSSRDWLVIVIGLGAIIAAIVGWLR